MPHRCIQLPFQTFHQQDFGLTPSRDLQVSIHMPGTPRRGLPLKYGSVIFRIEHLTVR